MHSRKKTISKGISLCLALILTLSGSFSAVTTYASVTDEAGGNTANADAFVAEGALTDAQKSGDDTAKKAAADETVQNDESQNDGSQNDEQPDDSDAPRQNPENDGKAPGPAELSSTDPFGSDEELDIQTVSGDSIDTSATYTLHFYDENTEILNPVSGTGGDQFLNILAPLGSGYVNPIRRGYRVNKWSVYEIHGAERTLVKTRTASQLFKSTRVMVCDYAIVAAWKENPVTYNINYNFNGGSFEDIPYAKTFTVESDSITLEEPVRAGYIFGGWYKDAALTTAITSIPHGTYVDTPMDGSDVTTFQLYAKWIDAKAQTVKLNKVSYAQKGTVKLSFDTVDKAVCYEVAFSTDKNFPAKKTATATVKKAGSFTVSNLLKKTYYVRVRAKTRDSAGDLTDGNWSAVKSVVVADGVKEVKAKLGRITLKKVEIKNGELHVTAKAPNRLKSSDASYYLVTVDPATNKILKKISAFPKAKSLETYVPLYGSKGTNLIQGKFAIAIKSGSKYKRMSKAAFISNPQAAAGYTAAHPNPASKKGLQDSSDDLNIKHIFYNIMVDDLIDFGKNEQNKYVYNGTAYYFNKALISQYGGCFSANNKKGIVTTAQFMLRYPNGNTYLVMKGARSGGHLYYAMNGTQKKARETYEALFNMLGEAWGNSSCHLDNWIIGNEVNIYTAWYYAGNNSRASIMKTYADMYKIVYYGVVSHSKNSRVYICTDHTWTDRSGDWGAKPFMTLFDKEIKKRNKKIQWNLAYHAYPAILTNARTWQDAHTTNSEDSEFVTPKNLQILTNYVKKKYGTKTRIILSEQGLTATGGEDVQAAALLYTYYKAQFNSQIDAVIFRALNDAPGEVDQGLAFGLTGRKAYNVFKYMDTPQSVSIAKPYLNTIGASSWKKIIPGYKASKFKSM